MKRPHIWQIQSYYISDQIMLYQCYKMGFDDLRSQASCFKGNLISFLLFAVLFGNVA